MTILSFFNLGNFLFSRQISVPLQSYQFNHPYLSLVDVFLSNDLPPSELISFPLSSIPCLYPYAPTFLLTPTASSPSKYPSCECW